MSTEMFVIIYPTGLQLRIRDLDDNALVQIQDQCGQHQGISRLESLEPDRTRFFLTPKSQRKAGWLGLWKSKCPFLDSRGQAPRPGRYQLVMAENEAELFDFGVCGTTVDVLVRPSTAVDSQIAAKTEFGQDLVHYLCTTDENAVVKYSICVVYNRLVVTLDYSEYKNDRLLAVKAPAELFEGEHPCGHISGQILNFATLLPYESLANVIMSFGGIETILVTGIDWSGTIAHAAAFILRGVLSQTNNLVPVKAVSFGGPLCGSPSLLGHIERSGSREHHITINNRKDLGDRLLCDYQKLSPLMTKCSSSDQRNFTYETLNVLLKHYQHAEAAAIPSDLSTLDVGLLRQAENNIANHVTLTSDDQLRPIGRYLFKESPVVYVIENHPSDVEQRVTLLDGKHLHGRNVSYTLTDVQNHRPSISPNLRRNSQQPVLHVKPKLLSLSMIWTSHRVTLSFAGENLDSVRGRLMDREIDITLGNVDSILPFRFRVGTLAPGKHAKITAITPGWSKLVIEVVGCVFPEEGEVSIFTDFGESNAVRFNAQNIVRGEESAPSKSLHPTMNAEFLSAAVLRIAIYCRKHGNLEVLQQNPRLYQLWLTILSLERRVCRDLTLKTYVEQYLQQDMDIGTMRNMCIATLSTVSKRTVEDFVYRENFLLRGGRKLIGYVSAGGSGIMFVISALLLIPTSLMAIPVVTSQAPESNSLSMMGTIGLGAYVGVMGLLAIPGAIVATMSYFMYHASAYALQDRESLQYKKLLKTLLTSLGGSPADVIDELCPIEDKVVQMFTAQYPGHELHKCEQGEIRTAIEQSIAKGSEEAKHLKEACDRTPILAEKLILVGHIHSIRLMLENSLMIGFTGVHNAGKSTTIARLFEMETGADLVVRTEEPSPYLLGDWMEQSMSEHGMFNDWMMRDEKRSLQLYAVDFPGTTDERLSVGLITKYTAELASIFVVILKAGHIAGPEKDVLQVAKDNRKPFLVVINQVDTIKHEIRKPGSFERIRASYAKVLDIPESMLFFMSAHDMKSINHLRGRIFGLVHNLLGSSQMSKCLSLKFISSNTIKQLLEENENASVLDIPDRLSEAASSLLHSHQPLSARMLSERIRLLNENVLLARQQRGTQKPSESNAERLKKTGILDALRQMAIRLDIDDDAYAVVTDVFNIMYEGCEQHVEMLKPEAANREYSALDHILGAMALASINDKIKTYFGTAREGSLPSDEPHDRIGAEVLLGIHSIYTAWVAMGFMPLVVKEALRSLLLSEYRFDDNHVNQFIVEAKATLVLSGRSQRNSTNTRSMKALSIRGLSVNDLQIELANKPTTRTVVGDTAAGAIDEVASNSDTFLDDFSMLEFQRYQEAKGHLVHLMALTHPTFPNMRHNNQGKGTIEDFREALKLHSTRYTKVEVLEVGQENIVEQVLGALLTLTEEQLNTVNIKFSIRGEPAVDMDGVTRSVLAKVAAEINRDCEKINLRKDNESGFVYFDPTACYSTKKQQDTKLYYKGLGRLIGLCLRKSIAGATLPIAFPITIYKWLLGYRIGLTDLSVISPQIANTIHQTCLMDEETLRNVQMTFAVTLESKVNGQEYALEPNGSDTIVTMENRMTYLSDLVKFHLCCFKLGEDNKAMEDLALGVQHLCPRELFNKLSPVSLQLVLEGNHDIDVASWRMYTEVKHGGYDNKVTIELFWKVVANFSEQEKQRLFCFAVGTTTLPANGFAELSPLFTLVIGTMTPDKLPVSHTCFHMLLLPRYVSEEDMRSKLLTACWETGMDHMGLI